MINLPKKEGSKWTAGFLAVLVTLQSLLPGILSLIMFFSVTGGYVMYNPKSAEAATMTVGYSSSGTWMAPVGVTSVTVEAWGGGGGAGGGGTSNKYGGGGGAGGQYAIKIVPVTSGQTYAYTVGSIGTGGPGNGSTTDGTAGGDTTFDGTTVVAKGGAGGQSYANGAAGGIGSTAGGVGDTVNAGGNGSNGTTTYGGGGAGGAGSTGTGQSGSTSTAGGATTLNGGAGGNGSTANNAAGSPGNNYGGAGGGGTRTGSGGNGAGGYMVLTYVATEIDVQNDPANTVPPQTIGASQTFGAQRFRVNATDGVVQINSMTISFGGTATDGAVSSIKIYTDSANNDNWDGAGSEGDLGGFIPVKPDSNTVASSIVFTSALTIPTGATGIDLWVAVTTKAGAPDGGTIITELNNGSDVNHTATNDNSSYPVTSPEHIITIPAGDSDPPDVTITDPTGPRTYVTASPSKLITGTSTDGAGVGVQSVQVQIQRDSDNKYWDDSVPTWSASPTWNNANNTTSWDYVWTFEPSQQDYSPSSSVTVRAIDYNSNTSSYQYVFDQRIDNQAPTITSSFSINGTDQYTTTTAVTLNNYVADGSGFMSAAFANSVGELATASFSDYLATVSYSLPPGDGTKWIYAQYRDNPPNADPPGGYNQTAGGVTDSYDTITLDATKPTVSGYSPTGSSELVTTNVTAAFSDTTSWMDTSSISETSFTLVTSGGSVPASVTFSSGVATLDPSSTLAYNTNYTASLSSDIKDNAGNTLDTVSWSFATESGAGDSDPPYITITDPTGGTLTNTSKLISGLATDAVGVTDVELRITRNQPTTAYWTGSGWGSETWIDAHMIDTGASSTNWDYSWNYGSGYDNYGDISIDARAMDAALNTGSASQVTGIYLDNTAPSGSFAIGIGNPTYTTTTSVTLTSSVSGAITMAFNDGITYDTTAYSPTRSWSLDSTNGNLTVWGSFIDTAGNTMTTSDSIFLDTVQPTSNNYYPPDLATTVTVDTLVTAAINDPGGGAASGVNSNTITTSSFYLLDTSGAQVPASVSFSSGVATLDPSSTLAYNSVYTASLSSGITDNAGNTLNAYNWSFTTESPQGAGELAVGNDPKGGDPPTEVNKGTNKNVTQRLLMTASGGSVTLGSITVSFSATNGASDVPTVYMFRDYNPENSSYDDAESGTLVSASYSGAVNFDIPNDTISSGNTRAYAVAVDVASGAQTSAGFSSNVASTSSIGISTGIVSPDFSNYGSGQFIITEGTPQVTGLSVIARAFPTMALSWNSVSGADYYEVARSLYSSGTFDPVTSSVAAITYNDILTSAAVYYYKVKAFKSSQWGPYSTAAASLSGNNNISISYSVPASTTSIQSADGQVLLQIPPGNNGTWNIEERNPSSYNFNSNITPQSPYVWFDYATPSGSFTIKLRTTKGPAGNTKVLWKYDGSGWSKNVGTNYSWSDYYFFNADVTGFSGYLVAGGVGNTEGQGPHGGFSSGSNKCKDCHAVHEAGEMAFKSGATYKLLRASTQEDVCEFCHGSAGVASKFNIVLQASGHGPAFTSGTVTAPDDLASGAFTMAASINYAWACIRCHNPHNGGTIQSLQYDKDSPTTSNKLLRANPSGNGTPLTSSVVYLSEWCAQCHGANIGTFGQSKEVPDGAGTTIAYGHDASTGGMNTRAYGSDIYADVPSGLGAPGPTCRQCHAAGRGTGYVSGQTSGQVWGGPTASAEGSFPHAGYSDSYGLLKSGIGTEQNATLDDVCNDCHFTPSLP